MPCDNASVPGRGQISSEVISFYGWLRNLIPFFSAITAAFTVGGIIYLFNSGMDSSAKLTWMFIIALLPITGAALLAFT